MSRRKLLTTNFNTMEKQLHDLVPVHPQETDLARMLASNVPVLRAPLNAVALTGREPIWVYSNGEILRAERRGKGSPYPSYNVRYSRGGGSIIDLGPNTLWDTDEDALRERVERKQLFQNGLKSMPTPTRAYAFDAEILTTHTDLFSALDTVSNGHGGFEMDDVSKTAVSVLGRICTALGVIGLKTAEDCANANIIDRYVYEVLKVEIEELYAFLKSMLHVVISSDISLPMTSMLKRTLLQAALEHVEAFLQKHSVAIQHTQFLVAHAKGFQDIMKLLKSNMHTREVFE